MFTPTEIEALPSAMEQLYRSLQLNIMSDLTERLKANGEEITSAADWQINRLYELGVSKDEIDSLIQNTLNVSDDEIDRIYDEVVKSGYARNEELYTGKGKEYISYAENKQLQQLVKAVKNQTKSEYRNITGSLGFAVRNADNTLSFTPLADFYQRTLDNGLMQIASGAVDYNTVLKRAVKAMTDSGLRTVDYASGWSNRVDVAVRRALMTGFNQVVAKVNEDNAEQLGTEYFEVSYHRGARPTHQVWQGRVYSKKELETVCGLGTVTGLCGANCYHSYSPFMKGIDTPTYSEEELDRMNEEENAPKEYNGRQYTAYEAQQRQRRLETAMRADRQQIELLTQGGADDDTITGAKAKYFQRQDEYVKFSKAMNLPQQWERITVDGKNALGSKLPKKAGNVNKISSESVAKSKKTVIMKSGSDVVALENQRYGRNKSTLVNKTYVDSGEYKRKYDSATDNKEVNKSLYDCAKKALKHRSGTAFEDMYWIDGETGRVMLSVTDSADERTITYTDRIKKCIQTNNNVVTIHTHPSSMPPSIEDFNSCANNGYAKCFVACHNGVLYGYHSNEMINPKLYNLYIQKYMNGGFSEMEAQVKTIKKLSQSFDINFWEVSYNG